MGWEGPEPQEEPGRARLCPGVSGCSRASQPRASSPWEPRDPPSPPRGTQPVTSVGCVCYPKGWGFSPLLFSLRAVPFAATQRRQLPLSARSVGTEAPPRPGAACAPSPPSPAPCGERAHAGAAWGGRARASACWASAPAARARTRRHQRWCGHRRARCPRPLLLRAIVPPVRPAVRPPVRRVLLCTWSTRGKASSSSSACRNLHKLFFNVFFFFSKGENNSCLLLKKK